MLNSPVKIYIHVYQSGQLRDGVGNQSTQRRPLNIGNYTDVTFRIYSSESEMDSLVKETWKKLKLQYITNFIMSNVDNI